MFAVRSLLSLPFASSGHVFLGPLALPWPTVACTALGAGSFPAINLLTQRWKYRARKPIGSPRSRKKKYYVRQPTPRVAEEMSELYWRYSHYRTETKSLREHFLQWKLDHYPQESLQRDKESVKLQVPSLALDSDFERILEENEQENSRVAAAREERRREEMALREAERLDVLMDYEDQLAEMAQAKEEQVRRKKEVVARMVIPENLDERIAKAFDAPVDYNFCITLRGKRIYGRPDPLNRINMAYTAKDDEEQIQAERAPERLAVSD